MGLRINNLSSLFAQTRLSKTEKAIARSIARLSSGRGATSPQENAPAYFLNVKLTSQIRGLTQINQGLNLALGMIDTADSAITSQMELVQRMRELALSASNGTMTSSERNNLDLEFQSLFAEYQRILQSTTFNGTTLLDGSFGGTTIQAGNQANDKISLTMPSLQTQNVFTDDYIVGAGTFQTRVTYRSGGTAPRYLDSGDFDHDGNVDFATADNSSAVVSIYFGNGTGTFSRTTSFAVGPSPNGLLVADLNNDGNLDVATPDSGGGNSLTVILGNGNGTFGARTTVFVSGMATPWTIGSGDFDGDNVQDLIASNINTSEVFVYIGNGNGTFKSPNLYVADSGVADQPYATLSFDVDLDGRIDLVTANRGVNSISIFLGNGNGTFKTRSTISAPTVRDVSFVDVNGDGKRDLLATWSTANAIAVYLGNGNGTFLAPTSYATSSAPVRARAADFNSDGILDLYSVDATGAQVGIWYGNGNGTFAARVAFSTPARDGMAIDVNGDGINDLVTVDSANNALSVMIQNTLTRQNTSVSVASQSEAERMLTVLDNALTKLSSAQADLGAIHSRLDHVVSYNLVLSENLEEARSRAVDVDYTMEIAELVRNQILQQVQVAMLAQANVDLHLVLKLLDH